MWFREQLAQYHRYYYSAMLLTTLAHTESSTRTTFIQFVSSGLGMCGRLTHWLPVYEYIILGSLGKTTDNFVDLPTT